MPPRYDHQSNDGTPEEPGRCGKRHDVDRAQAGESKPETAASDQRIVLACVGRPQRRLIEPERPAAHDASRPAHRVDPFHHVAALIKGAVGAGACGTGTSDGGNMAEIDGAVPVGAEVVIGHIGAGVGDDAGRGRGGDHRDVVAACRIEIIVSCRAVILVKRGFVPFVVTGYGHPVRPVLLIRPMHTLVYEGIRIGEGVEAVLRVAGHDPVGESRGIVETHVVDRLVSVVGLGAIHGARCGLRIEIDAAFDDGKSGGVGHIGVIQIVWIAACRVDPVKEGGILSIRHLGVGDVVAVPD